MATSWARWSTRPSPIREHATCLSTFLHDVLHLIKRTGNQSIVSDIIRGSLTFFLKMQHTPDLSAISDVLHIAQTEAKATAQAIDVIQSELKNTVELVQQSSANIPQNGNTAEEARAAAMTLQGWVKRRWRLRERSGTRDHKRRRTE